jgi:putative transposase
MTHTYICYRVHVIFSTAERRRLINPRIESELWKYIGGVARNYDMKAHAVGGVEDHIHILLAMPPTMSLAKAVQVIKANSSRWMKAKGCSEFAWQQGYAAASVSFSNQEKVAKYILRQREHHARQSSEAEWEEFLRKNILKPMPSLRDSDS